VIVVEPVLRHPSKVPEGWGISVGLAEVGLQDKTRQDEGMLMLFESKQVSGGSGLLSFEGHHDKMASEAVLVAFDYVRSHMQQIQQSLPCSPSPQRNLLAQDVDTLINGSPVNIGKMGPSCK
jgi:predicted ATP-dependent Lon-type protease